MVLCIIVILQRFYEALSASQHTLQLNCTASVSFKILTVLQLDVVTHWAVNVIIQGRKTQRSQFHKLYSKWFNKMCKQVLCSSDFLIFGLSLCLISTVNRNLCFSLSHTHTHTHTRARTHTCMQQHALVHIHTHACTYIQTDMHMHTHMNIYSHTHSHHCDTHKHTYTHTHTQKRKKNW